MTDRKNLVVDLTMAVLAISIVGGIIALAVLNREQSETLNTALAVVVGAYFGRLSNHLTRQG